jgi:hypothetical protein
MFFQNVFARLCRKPVRRAPIRRSAATRPMLEALEDRMLLSAVFTVTNTNDSGAGSLRQAILNSNAKPSNTSANPGPNYIHFDIGSGAQTIAPLSALPTITSSVVLEGSSQPGYAGKPLIQLSGRNLSSSRAAAGLDITAGDSTVQGLVINGFSAGGIELAGDGSNTIQGNYLGTDTTGTHAVGGGGMRVLNSSGNLIGGTSAADRNIISGNSGSNGLLLSSQSNNNRIEGNYIGTDITGKKALGNGQDGIAIRNASHNLIGGTGLGSGNVIARNVGNGVGIYGSGSSSSIENQVEENWIGTDRTGTLHLGNTQSGVFLYSSSSATVNSYGNEIGGSAPWLDGGSWGSVPAGVANIIAFNHGAGVRQAGYRMFNNPIRGNSIHDNGGLPISLQSWMPFTANVNNAHAGTATTVVGSVASSAAQELLLDFYASKPSEFGQERRYLGSMAVQASDFSHGIASFTANVGATQPGEVVTVTATGYYGNTSQVDTGKPAWADLGGFSLSPVATGHEANGRIVLVELGTDQAIYIQIETAPNSGAFGSPQDLFGYVPPSVGGSHIQSLQVVTDATGRLQVLVIGSDTALWVRSETAANSGTFSGWQSLGGSGIQQIAVAKDQLGLPVVFAVGNDSGVYFQWENSPGSWSGWYTLGKPGGDDVQSISVGLDYGGKLAVAAVDTYNVAWEITQSFPNSVAFDSWQFLGYSVKQLVLTTDGSGRLTAFALGEDNHVYSQSEDFSDNWSASWSYLGGWVQSITVSRDASGRMEVAAVGFDDQVYTLRQTAANGSWSNWSTGYGGTVWPGTVTLGQEANGTLLAFAEFDDIDTSSWDYLRL